MVESQPIEHIAERAFKYYREDQVLTVLDGTALHCAVLYFTLLSHSNA